MKKGYQKLLIVELIMFFILGYSFFNNVNSIFYAIYLFVIFVILYLLVGFEKENQIHRLDVIRKVFVYSMLYMMIIYILGFAIGFVKNPYSFELIKIVTNITPLLLIIIFGELIRYSIAKKAYNQKYIITILVILLTLFDISRSLNLYPLTNSMEIFEFISLLIIPSITKNLLLTYIASYGYYKPNIIYQIIFSLNAYIIPIYPNLGVYLEAVFSIVVPAIIYVGVSAIFYEQKLPAIKGINFKRGLIILPVTGILLVTIMLTSGLFKYYAMSVGSNSMYPKIERGDVIVIEKINYQNFEIGDILVHHHGSKIILHRIIKVVTVNGHNCYKTKGDNNDSADGYNICERDIKGKAVLTVPYIGWPSVMIEQLME